jgi:hypothetical protein
MGPLHYLIFHPDGAREKTKVRASALVGGQLIDWQGSVWVDKPNGNEDPFIFSTRWLYSYCHATQLRRTPRPNSAYIKTGSYLFFCSGNSANKEIIQLDTVFVVNHVAKWPQNQQGLPDEFKEHYRNSSSDLWRRHFRYPFHGYHEGKYTYVSRQWFENKDAYSFLPISTSGERVAFDMGVLTRDVRLSILSGVPGKYPVLLSDQGKTEMLRETLAMTQVQVIGDLSRGIVSSNVSK